MSKKTKLPAGCSIERVGETKRDRAFQLRFGAEQGEDYVSEIYVPDKGESIERAAHNVCVKFDWFYKPPGAKGRLIHTLAEFLEWRGCGGSPYQWARAFYKYTDCGPWAQFLELVTPARDIEHPTKVAVIRRVRNRARLVNAGELDPKFVQFLGLDKDGLDRKERTWAHYCKLVHAYVADDAKQKRTGRTLELVEKTKDELRLRQPACTEHVGADYREVYYEDLGRGTATLDPVKCCGIKFGSIVEGSEACSGPFTHMFPFWTSDFDRDIEHMKAETSFYWKRDNASWYRVRTDDDEWVVANVWGDIEWEEGEPPKRIKALAEKAIKNDWQPDPKFDGAVIQTIPKMPSVWRTPKESDKDWKAMPLGKTGAEIFTFTDDTTFD